MPFNKKPTSEQAEAGIFAPNFQDMALKAGRVGGIWGVDVLESVVVPTANTYVLAPADYLGVLAVRTDISVETYEGCQSNGRYFRNLGGYRVSYSIRQRDR